MIRLLLASVTSFHQYNAISGAVSSRGVELLGVKISHLKSLNRLCGIGGSILHVSNHIFMQISSDALEILRPLMAPRCRALFDEWCDQCVMGFPV